MKNPWLIQRLKLRPGVENPQGIDALYACDYMGSAEFEWGALPRSLREITGELQNFVITEVTPAVTSKDSLHLYAICHKDQVEDLMKFVPELITGKTRLKESAYLRQALLGIDQLYNFDAWWDIDNNWMLVLGENNANKTMLALTNLKERWLKEGKIK